MFIAQPPGYEIRENTSCKPFVTVYGTLNDAIKGCPSCMIFKVDTFNAFYTCYADAEIFGTSGSRLYIKSK